MLLLESNPPGYLFLSLSTLYTATSFSDTPIKEQRLVKYHKVSHISSLMWSRLNSWLWNMYFLKSS